MTTDANTGGTRGAARAALVLGALGVVFGDIGTSPLYAMQAVFSPHEPHPVRISAESVYGIASMIFWSVTLIVTVTYVLLVMRADNHGEGGIMALITLIRTRGARGRTRTTLLLTTLGIFGASLFLGDSMITPAISVLSAVDGLKVAAPTLEQIVVPVTAAVILVLFLVQRIGTAAVGRVFGPVMLVWFVAIAACGVKGIAGHPQILKALSPTYAWGYLTSHFVTAFFALAAVVLAVTGAEALYADMGHFGRPPITRAWLLIVFPACILSYLGQGALILGHPASISNPFFLLVPGWARWPLVLLATAATVIASQAVISGAFSVAHQAVALGYLPRLRVAHTSEHAAGQIYVAPINWLLMISVLALVVIFKTATALAFAYGVAVTGTITITTLLFFYIARRRWHPPLWLLAPGAALLLTVDLLFLSANLTKILHGAWLPLLIAGLAFTVLVTWQQGREIVTARREREEGPLRAFVDDLHAHRPPVTRAPGTAVFLHRTNVTAPLAMRACVQHLRALNEHVVILSIETLTVAHVDDSQRIAIDDLGYADDGITHATARFGYMDEPDIPAVMRLIAQAPIESPIDVDGVSYFLSTIDLYRSRAPGLSPWRKSVFLALAQLTADAADYFGLPRDRTVVMGARIEV